MYLSCNIYIILYYMVYYIYMYIYIWLTILYQFCICYDANWGSHTLLALHDSADWQRGQCSYKIERFGGFLKQRYSQIIHFKKISIINHPFLGTPISGTPHIKNEPFLKRFSKNHGTPKRIFPCCIRFSLMHHFQAFSH